MIFIKINVHGLFLNSIMHNTMTEKGIVQDSSDGKIQLKLESPQTQSQISLPFEFKCDEKLVKGESVTVLLSPPPSIRAKPWELLVAMGLFFMGWVCGYKLIGFLLAIGFFGDFWRCFPWGVGDHRSDCRDTPLAPCLVRGLCHCLVGRLGHAGRAGRCGRQGNGSAFFV